MKDFAKRFYKSIRWQNTRDAYMKSVGGLCERCSKAGLIVPGEIVHHKTPLTPENIDDPDISLSWDNLELLCRQCHYVMHNASKRRFVVDDAGHILPVE